MNMTQGLLRWVRRQVRSPDTPGIPKKSLESRRLSPKKERLRRQVMKLAPPRMVRAWEDGPLRIEDAWQGEPRPTATGTRTHLARSAHRPKCVPAQLLRESSAYAPLCLEIIGICLPSHQPDEYGTRPIFRWVRAQGSHSQKCLGLRRHFPKKGHLRRRAMNLATPRRVRASGYGPLRLDDTGQGEPRPTATGTRTHPTRSAHR